MSPCVFPSTPRHWIDSWSWDLLALSITLGPVCSSSFLVRFCVPVGISSMSFCVSGPVLLIVAFSTASLSHLLLFFGVGLVFRFCFLLVLFPSSFSYHSCGCRCFFFHEKNCSGLHISKIFTPCSVVASSSACASQCLAML